MRRLFAKRVLHVIVQRERFHSIGYAITAEAVVERVIKMLEEPSSSFVISVKNGTYVVCPKKEPTLVAKIHRSGRIKLSPSLDRVKTTRSQRKQIRSLLKSKSYTLN